MDFVKELTAYTTPIATLCSDILSITALLVGPAFVIWAWSRRAWKKGSSYRVFVKRHKEKCGELRDEKAFKVDEALCDQLGIDHGEYGIGEDDVTRVKVHTMSNDFVLPRRVGRAMRVVYTTPETQKVIDEKAAEDQPLPRSVQEMALRYLLEWMEASQRMGTRSVYHIDCEFVRDGETTERVWLVYCKRFISGHKLHYVYFEKENTLLIVRKGRARFMSRGVEESRAEERLAELAGLVKA